MGNGFWQHIAKTSSKTLPVKTNMLPGMQSARHILAQNLRALMSKYPSLDHRDKIAARSGVSARTVGYMLQSGEGNPTLASIEAVADAFRVPVWRLLTDSPNVDKLLLLQKILGSDGVSDEYVGDQWNATLQNGTPAAREPPTPYQARKKGRKPNTGE
jgi:transcriptional regulator with XRE-family HTH domain